MSDTSVADDLDDGLELDDADTDKVDGDADPADTADEGEVEPDEHPSTTQDQPTRQTRNSTSDQIREAKKRAREATERAAKVEREFNELKTRLAAAPQPTQADLDRQAAQESERLALMSPEERLDYKQQQFERRQQQRDAQLFQAVGEQNDKSAFAALQATDPLAKKYASEVEELVRSRAAAGAPVQREVALNFILGKKLREQAGKGGKERRAAGDRVAAATTRTARPGGDEGSDRGERRGGDQSERDFERKYGSVKF